MIEEAALANPGVRFTYKAEGRQVLRLEPEDSGDFFQDFDFRAAAVLGDDLAGGLLPIDVERPGVRVRMLVSPYDKMPSSRSFQYFFVNKRPISSKILQAALYKAYGEHRPAGKQPVCVALLELNPDSFDANVHPGKREIRFKKDGEIFEIVSGLVASALAKAKAAAPITLAPEPVTIVADAPEPHYLGGRGFIPDAFTQLKLGAAVALSAPEGAPAWYTPAIEFNHHYFPKPADMNDAEAKCAAEIDKCPSTEHWVRNLTRHDCAFWLLTSTDKFYPDFVALRKDGRVAVVEFKASKDVSYDDNKEKNAIGEVWAARSAGECRFAMVTEKDYQTAVPNLLSN